MFKKITTLVLVLALAQMASAVALIQLSVDGQLAPDRPDPAAVIGPSDTVELDIDLVEGEFDGLDIALQITGPGSIDVNSIAYPATGWSLGPSVVADPAYDLRLTASVLTILGVPPVPAPDVLANNIIFHCDGDEDVIIDLIATGSTTGYLEGDIIDSILIKQPEPMTVALLGMGGLFLRRKRA